MKPEPFLTEHGSEASSEEDLPLPTNFTYIGIRGPGRVLYFYEVVELLSIVREMGQWPTSVKQPMRDYYRREYPEFFTDSKRAIKKREEQIARAATLKANKRPSRSRRKKVSTPGLEPIDIQSRRRTGA